MSLQAVKDYITVLNGLTVPVGNLGMSRQSMPQIDNVDEFIDVLSDNKIGVLPDTVNLSELRLTQAEINKDKVLKLLKLLRKRKYLGRVIVSKDDYVIDGSHRFVALLNRKGRHGKIDILRVDMNALQLIGMLNANRFEYGVRYRSYSGAELDG